MRTRRIILVGEITGALRLEISHRRPTGRDTASLDNGPVRSTSAIAPLIQRVLSRARSIPRMASSTRGVPRSDRRSVLLRCSRLVPSASRTLARGISIVVGPRIVVGSRARVQCRYLAEVAYAGRVEAAQGGGQLLLHQRLDRVANPQSHRHFYAVGVQRRVVVNHHYPTPRPLSPRPASCYSAPSRHPPRTRTTRVGSPCLELRRR